MPPRTHPVQGGWINVADILDVVIIGSGPGGYVAAIRAGQLGLKTAIVERDKRLGGTCLHRGCIPTKALLWTAELYSHIQQAAEFGIDLKAPTINWPAAMEHKAKVVTGGANGIDYLMKKNKVQVVKGHGRITGKGKVEVTLNEGGGKQVLETKNIIIATGSVPKSLPNVPVDHKLVYTSDSILEIAEIPKSILVLGAGEIGYELSARVQKVEPGGKGVKVTMDTPSGSKTVEAAILLSAVGRSPVTEGVGLETTSIKLEKGFVPVDDFMRTTEPHVYAIGDVIPGPMLAHMASAEGILAVEHIAGKEVHPINYDLTPSATYCYPEVASVGLTEKKAKERGYEVKTGTFPFSAILKAKISEEGIGMVKVVSDKKYDEVLGVHMVGPHATELLAEACVALRLEITTEELGRTIHAHPTLSEIVKEGAEATLGTPIHI